MARNTNRKKWQKIDTIQNKLLSKKATDPTGKIVANFLKSGGKAGVSAGGCPRHRGKSGCFCGWVGGNEV